MIVKIYVLIWMLGLLAVGLTYFTGNLTQLVAIVFGFLSFGAVFMGMLSVLPSTIHHQTPTKH